LNRVDLPVLGRPTMEIVRLGRFGSWSSSVDRLLELLYGLQASWVEAPATGAGMW
jgi:hypothetical protein